MNGPAALPIEYAIMIIAFVVVPVKTDQSKDLRLISRVERKKTIHTFCVTGDNGLDPAQKNDEWCKDENCDPR